MSGYSPTSLTGYVELDDAEATARVEAFRAAMAVRRTVRDFSSRPVPRALVEAALLTAGAAPSGANHQPWFFSVIESAELRREIRVAAEREEREFYDRVAPQEWREALAPLGTDADKSFLETAPILIAVFAQTRGGPKRDDDKKNYYVPQSVGIATGFLIAALHAGGLATLTHTPAPMHFLNRLCQRPATEKPFLLLVVGHPAKGAKIPAAALEKKGLRAIAEWR